MHADEQNLNNHIIQLYSSRRPLNANDVLLQDGIFATRTLVWYDLPPGSSGSECDETSYFESDRSQLFHFFAHCCQSACNGLIFTAAENMDSAVPRFCKQRYSKHVETNIMAATAAWIHKGTDVHYSRW